MQVIPWHNNYSIFNFIFKILKTRKMTNQKIVLGGIKSIFHNFLRTFFLLKYENIRQKLQIESKSLEKKNILAIYRSIHERREIFVTLFYSFSCLKRYHKNLTKSVEICWSAPSTWVLPLSLLVTKIFRNARMKGWNQTYESNIVKYKESKVSVILPWALFITK